MADFKAQPATVFERDTIFSIGEDPDEPPALLLLHLQLDEVKSLSLQHRFDELVDTLKEHFAVHTGMTMMKKSGLEAHPPYQQVVITVTILTENRR